MAQNVLNEFKSSGNDALEHLRETLLAIRTGRAHPALVEDIMVDYYGTMTPIKSMGTVVIPEARQILITPWDKSALAAIEKGILASSLGVTPQNDGDAIRLNLPELTKQRRIDLCKIVNKEAEDTRISVRNGRRDANDSLKKMEKSGDISEDDLKKYLEKVQEITDTFIKKIDEMAATKEKEVMEV